MKKVLIVLCAIAALMASCVQEVKVSSITLDKTAITLDEGQTQTLRALVNPADATDQSITWASDNSAVATVDQSGKVTAVKAGKANITVTSVAVPSVKATCEVTVNGKEGPDVPPGPGDTTVESVDLSETDPVSILVGETYEVEAIVTPRDAQVTVTWASSDPEVATVANGVITAVAEGTANITASAGGVTSDALSVTVYAPAEPQNIFAFYQAVTIRVGQTAPCWAYYGDGNFGDREDIDDPVWTSADESVATANGGNIYGVGPGTTVVTISDGLGSSLDIPVTVTEIPEDKGEYLPGIRLLEPDFLYDGTNGWFAEGNRFLGEGFVPGTQCFHINNHDRDDRVYRIAQAKFKKVDVSSIQNPALYLRVYINDVSLLMCDGANSQIELASGGEDWCELTWTGGRVFKNWWPEYDQINNGDIKKKYELKNGWNTIVLPFDWAEHTGGVFEPNRVCWFRWYNNPDYAYDLRGKGLEVAVDDLRVVDWTEYEPVENKNFWMESGTGNNWGAYAWLDELDGHHGVFGGKDEYMGAVYTNIWLRDRSGSYRWSGREYSIPANSDGTDMKLQFDMWVDDPTYFNNVIFTVELATGSGMWDNANWKWGHMLNLHQGWNTIEEDFAAAGHEGNDPYNIRSMYTFRIVFTNEGAATPGIHSYFIDNIRIVKK